MKFNERRIQLESYKENFSTPDKNFNETNQFSIDFVFADQLVDILKEINNEFSLAKLKMEDITGYDGKNFIVKNKKMSLDGLKKYAKDLDEKNKKEFLKQAETEKEENEDKAFRDKNRWWDK